MKRWKRFVAVAPLAVLVACLGAENEGNPPIADTGVPATEAGEDTFVLLEDAGAMDSGLITPDSAFEGSDTGSTAGDTGLSSSVCRFDDPLSKFDDKCTFGP